MTITDTTPAPVSPETVLVGLAFRDRLELAKVRGRAIAALEVSAQRAGSSVLPPRPVYTKDEADRIAGAWWGTGAHK